MLTYCSVYRDFCKVPCERADPRLGCFHVAANCERRQTFSNLLPPITIQTMGVILFGADGSAAFEQTEIRPWRFKLVADYWKRLRATNFAYIMMIQ